MNGRETAGPSGPVVLLTDFGRSSWYAGVMKGVILGILPRARIVDLCHCVPPQCIMEGAFILRACIPYFPSGSVFVCVVDPGVGGARKDIVVDTGRQLFTGPDNGLLTPAVEQEGARVYEITEKRYQLPARGSTFYGRDVFAPVGAHLAAGVPAAKTGRLLDSAETLDIPEAVICEDGAIRGSIVHIDTYGNILTDVAEELIDRAFGQGARPHLSVDIGDIAVHGIGERYDQGEPGELMALINSWGCLEIAANMCSAADHPALPLARTCEVRVYRR